MTDKTECGDEPFIEVRIYLSPKDNKRVLGLYTIGLPAGPKNVTYHFCKYGTLAPDAVNDAVAVASQYGLDFVWVNDPKCLFQLDRLPS